MKKTMKDFVKYRKLMNYLIFAAALSSVLLFFFVIKSSTSEKEFE